MPRPQADRACGFRPIARQMHNGISSGGKIMGPFRKRIMRQSVALLMATCSAGIVLSGRPAMKQNKKPTARELVAAIQEHVGIPWQKETVDTFKAGNPDTPVTGIAVTMMA